MTISAALALPSLAFAGFSALAAATHRHQATLLSARARRPAWRTTLRLTGAIALIAACLVSAATWGWPLGTLLWLGTLTPAAALVAVTLTYAPSRAMPAALASLVTALLATAAAQMP